MGNVASEKPIELNKFRAGNRNHTMNLHFLKFPSSDFESGGLLRGGEGYILRKMGDYSRLPPALFFSLWLHLYVLIRRRPCPTVDPSFNQRFANYSALQMPPPPVYVLEKTHTHIPSPPPHQNPCLFALLPYKSNPPTVIIRPQTTGHRGQRAKAINKRHCFPLVDAVR